MLDDLLAPAESLLVWYSIFRRGRAYYRLGKKRPSSGILSRCSSLALSIQTPARTPDITAPMTKVLAFQFAGWAYQPPAGDQTCLGYLVQQRVRSAWSTALAACSYGIFPPPPIVNRVCCGSVVAGRRSSGVRLQASAAPSSLTKRPRNFGSRDQRELQETTRQPDCG